MSTSTHLASPALRSATEPLLLAGATANVVMQLAHMPVGHGVAKSSVDSGNVMIHPWKRLRTTLSYLAVAMLGTDAEKLAYRRAVDGAHRHVVSAPGAEVAYNAFDQDLQLWVAACIYQGFALGHEAMHGPLDDGLAEALYQEASTFGTTLQVPRDMWPADRAAFADYWERGLQATEVDDLTRDYLWGLTNLRQLPAWQRWPFVRLNRFLTTGFLPADLRTKLDLPWSPRRQRRFDRIFRSLGVLSRFQPRPVREFPYNVLMWDVRRRIRLGRPLV